MTNIERFPRRLRFVLERIPRPKRLQAKRIAWHIAPKKRQLSKVEIEKPGRDYRQEAVYRAQWGGARRRF